MALDLDWVIYEHQMVKRHALEYPDAVVLHWTHVPEPMLEEAGYIHGRNQWRLKNKRKNDINPLSDYGLDGLARVGPDEFHGLQAKRRKAGLYLRAADLGSFQMVIQRMRVKCPKSQGIIYTDAKLSHELADDIEIINTYKVVHMPLDCVVAVPDIVVSVQVPWPHQVEALDALAKWDTQLGALVMPPGSGKTMIMGMHGRRVDRVVVCSPTRALATQTLETMGQLMPDHRRLLVDCDGTRDNDYIKSAWDCETPLLLSTTYFSMRDKVREHVKADTIVMIDEAHHVMDRMAETVEMVEQTGCRVLLVTGTPPSVVMDDDIDVVYRYDYDRAVRDGRICDYCIYLPQIVDPVGDVDHDDLVLRLGNDMVSRCHFIANGMLRTGSTRCIIYAGTCKEAADYKDAIVLLARQFHNISAWSGVIIDKVSPGERTQLLSDFQYSLLHRWHFLCSVRVLDEGIDVPTCDAVYIGQSVGNQARFVQRMCRANRLDYRGKVASVLVWTEDVDLDATILATAGVVRSLGRGEVHIERISTDYAESTAFDSTLADRVTVLCVSVAERWIVRLTETESFINQHDRLPSASDPVEKRIGIWVGTQKKNYAVTPEESKHIMKEMHSEWTELMKRYPQAFETYEQAWRRSAAETESFINQHDRLPSARDPVEKRLSSWVGNQKTNYAVTPEESKHIMKEMHGEWTGLMNRHPQVFETFEQAWRRSAAETESFIKQHDRLPSKKDSAEKRLGNWVVTQKTNYAVTPEASKFIMKEMHSEWTALMQRHPQAFETHEQAWRRLAAETESFIKQHDRLPSSRDPAEKRLGIWVGHQKKNYAETPEASKNIMKEMHGEWTALMKRHPQAFETYQQAWRRSAAEIESFIKQHDRLPSTSDPAEKRLGEWVRHQKTNYATTPEASKHIMKEMHGEWMALMKRHPQAFEAHQQAWRRSAAETESFIRQHDRLPSRRDPAEKRLGLWVGNQKKNYAVTPEASKQIMKSMHGEWKALIKRHPQAFESVQ
jgi:superfamily II DNA or RNA helicase